jgi:hypothetical protein
MDTSSNQYKMPTLQSRPPPAGHDPIIASAIDHCGPCTRHRAGRTRGVVLRKYSETFRGYMIRIAIVN